MFIKNSAIFQDYNRIGIMSESVQSYILNYLRDGTAVGIVSFNTAATTNAPMTELTGSAVRSDLASKVPTVADGGTGIAHGLQRCQSVNIYLLYVADSLFCKFYLYLNGLNRATV